jgi:tight adherence protein B
MGVIFIAMGVAVVAYIAINVLFPGIVPEEKEDFTRQALDRIYDETNSNQREVESDSRIALRNQLEDDTPWVRRFYGTPLTRPMYQALVQAGYRDQALNISFYSIAGAFVLIIGCFQMGFGIMSLLFGPVLAYILTYWVCMRKVKKRNLAFLNQFADALDMIVRSMRAGFPLNTAIQMIAENMEEPCKSEFRYVLNDISIGRSVNQALSRLAARIDEQDVRFFAVMVAIQQETGGNLAEVLGNLSKILRQRKQLRDKMRALTSEGRATGWILSGLPVFVFVTLYILQPAYIEPLWTDPLGQMFFGAAIGLIVICHFIVRRMTDLEV